jgi:hypothetical protein
MNQGVIPPVLADAGSFPHDNVNVPVFMGGGAVSVNVLDVAVFSPNRARLVPEAAIQVRSTRGKDLPCPGRRLGDRLALPPVPPTAVTSTKHTSEGTAGTVG